MKLQSLKPNMIEQDAAEKILHQLLRYDMELTDDLFIIPSSQVIELCRTAAHSIFAPVPVKGADDE